MSAADQGGMSLNRGIVLQLLRRIDSFNEWGLCQVLSIVCRYTPVDEDEGFSIMNLLDPVSTIYTIFVTTCKHIYVLCIL
jgi:AP-4 complex subunit beta-1